MKFCCVSIILAVIASVNGSMEEIIRECIDQEGASQSDVQRLQKMQMPESRTQKCFYACFFEKIGTSDGQRFDKERFMQVGEALAKNDQNKMTAIRAMADRCDGTENEDRCELAADIAACLKGQ